MNLLLSGKAFPRVIVRKLLVIMKLTAILILIGTLHVSARTFSQKVSISGKNLSLNTVFNSIQKQTGYQFFYSKDILGRSKPVTINLINSELTDALNACLKNQGLNFEISDNIIVIKVAENKDLNSGSGEKHFSAVYNSFPIKGYVTDGDGNPLVGATVTVKGANTSAKASGDGSFLINANSGDILVISFVGYEPAEVKLNAAAVKNGNIGTTELVISPTALKDVEVNKGYYTQKQIENTGNVFTVKGDDLRKQPVTDPMVALEGRVPGLMISQGSGVPGGPVKIQLRGQNFIYNSKNANNNDPLYIVDGIPFTSSSFLGFTQSNVITGRNNNGITTSIGVINPSPFNILNPADIETIDVLKDADATAIYGSRGANGVILITTKKGKAGQTKVNVNYSKGYSKQTVTSELMSTNQYLQMRREAFTNDGLSIPSISKNPYDRNYDLNGVWDTLRYTDWASELMGKTAVYSNAQASISGGSANTQFFLGAVYTKQGTYFPGAYADQKGGVSVNLSHNSVSQKFCLNFSGFYSTDNSDIPGIGSGFINYYSPNAPSLYNKQGDLNWEIYEGASTFANPLANMYIHSKTITNYLSSSLILQYKILSGLNVKTTFSYGSSQATQEVIYPSTAAQPPSNSDPSNRSYSYSNSPGQTWNNETQLIYGVNIGKGKLDVLAGTTLQDSKGRSIAYSARGYSSDALIANISSASTFSSDYSSSFEYRFSSIYGRLGYSWDTKYLLNLTARRDGSSRFGPGKQFGNFGSIGAAWIFSSEKFMRNSSWLSLGKLRMSYGLTGSDGIGNYSYLSLYRTQSGTYQGLTGLNPSGLTNPHYEWQENKKWEAALELGFLRDRINTTISYYQNRSGNQLVLYNQPYTTGFTSLMKNFPALVQNNGWEFTLNAFNVRSKNLKWNTSLNFSVPRNKLISFPNIETSAYRNFYAVGKSLSIRYGPHYLGVDPQTGLYSFANKSGSGYGFSTDQDFSFSKPVTQQYYGGISNSISFKGVTIDFFIQFVKQLGDSYQKSFSMPGSGNNEPPLVFQNRWQKPGDIAKVQAYSTGTAGLFSLFANSWYDYFKTSDGIITDASFIRFKNLNISYQLPKSLQHSLHLLNARIYIQMQNLFTITRYQVLDPETQNLFAPVKTIVGGIQLTF